MPRAGPLQELPLEQFLPLASNILSTPFKRPNKRAHSPGGPSLYSPAKRRILDVEGIRSPEKLVNSPLTSSRGSGRFAPSYFNALLHGPDSPAKRLDFGAPGTSGFRINPPSFDGSLGAATPMWNLCESKLAPSPKLLDGEQRISKTANASIYRDPTINDVEMDDRVDLADHLSASLHAFESLMIPHEVIPPDRQSIHYPGFDIYQDPYVATHNASGSVLQSGSGDDSTASKLDKERDKENLPPRRRLQKSTVAPSGPGDAAWVKAGLSSPAVKRNETSARPKAVTPHVKGIYGDLTNREGSLTPMRRSRRLLERNEAALVKSSPSRTPVGKEERTERRNALEDEVDDFEDDLAV